jgi:hypothetical protein
VIPVGAIVWALAGARGGKKPGQGMAALRLVALVVVTPICSALLAKGNAAGLVIAALAAPFVFPRLTLKLLVVPLGRPRFAYHFARFCLPYTYAAEPRGAPAFFAALAAVRAPVIETRDLDWLDARLELETKMRASSVAAAGLLAAARGKPGTARRLFESIDGISWRVVPRGVRRVARTWLVADAARRGDWSRVARLGRGSYFRWPHAVASMARRLTRDPRAPSSAFLWMVWAFAPRRLATRALLRRALDTPRLALPVPDAGEPRAESAPEEALSLALTAHAAALARPTTPALLRASRAWESAAAAGSTTALLSRRVLSAGASLSADTVMARVLATAREDLSAHAAHLAPRQGEGSLVAAIGAEARRRDLEELELAVSLLAERAKGAGSLHVLNEWMEWARLKSLCERIQPGGDAEAQRTVFAILHPALVNYGAWLFNRRSEKLLANTIFRWLLVQAKGVGDAETLALLKRNVKVGHGA